MPHRAPTKTKGTHDMEPQLAQHGLRTQPAAFCETFPNHAGAFRALSCNSGGHKQSSQTGLQAEGTYTNKALMQNGPKPTEPKQTKKLHMHGSRTYWVYTSKVLTPKESTQRGPRHRNNLRKQGPEHKEFKQRGRRTEGVYTKSALTNKESTQRGPRHNELAQARPRAYTKRGREIQRIWPNKALTQKEAGQKEPRHTSNVAKQGYKQKEPTQTKP